MAKARGGTDLGAGLFVLLGFVALAFLTTQTTSKGVTLTRGSSYKLSAEFDNVGDLKVGAPVTMAGVEVGSVTSIGYDLRAYKAVVGLNINTKYNQIPTDSDAAIYTQGLLGGKFIGLTPGGQETYLKDSDRIEFTQSAFVLENLIGQFLANFGKGDNKAGGEGASSKAGEPADKAGTPAEKSQ